MCHGPFGGSYNYPRKTLMDTALQNIPSVDRRALVKEVDSIRRDQVDAYLNLVRSVESKLSGALHQNFVVLTVEQQERFDNIIDRVRETANDLSTLMSELDDAGVSPAQWQSIDGVQIDTGRGRASQAAWSFRVPIKFFDRNKEAKIKAALESLDGVRRQGIAQINSEAASLKLHLIAVGRDEVVDLVQNGVPSAEDVVSGLPKNLQVLFESARHEQVMAEYHLGGGQPVDDIDDDIAEVLALKNKNNRVDN